MLRDADLSLANWVRSLLPPDAGVRFDTPRAAWEVKGTGTPFVSLFLYEARRDSRDLPRSGWSEQRDGAGRVVGRQPAARYYRILYVATAWEAGEGAGAEASPRTLEEHQLLGLLLGGCAMTDTIPDEHLTGALAEGGLPCFVRCGDDGPGRSTQALWSALGIAPRGHVVLELTAPVVPPLLDELAPPPREVVLGAANRPTRDRAGAATDSVRRRDRGTVTEQAPRR